MQSAIVEQHEQRDGRRQEGAQSSASQQQSHSRRLPPNLRYAVDNSHRQHGSKEGGERYGAEASPGQAQPRGDRQGRAQGGASRSPHHEGVSQGIAEETLEGRASGRQPRADKGGQESPGQAQVPDDGYCGRVGWTTPRGVEGQGRQHLTWG